MTRIITAALLAAALPVFMPAPAEACGGFFCSGGVNNPPPVIQTGEKILFAFEDDRVTAHVQILYQGDPRAFAWVVPTPGVPTLKVGSDQVFTVIDSATQPQFQINWVETCPRGPTLGCATPAALGESAVGGEFDAGTGGVNVLSQQPVGPFDTAVLSATDPNALRTWLSTNGFDLAPEANPLIDYYVEKGDYFVALKLQSDKGVGDLQPIVLEYEAPEGPCVPIKLTAVAAQEDLGIAVFLLGEGRGVPANYLHLEVNEAKIDWFNRGQNYPDVVTQAANEAGGQGFVTDYAGPSSIVRPALQQAYSRFAKTAVQTTDPVEFVAAIRDAGFLGTSQNVTAILSRCVPPPAGAASDPAMFYQNIESWRSELEGSTVEQPKCADDFESLVVQPLRDVVALIDDHPKLTRLYTTMSAHEMTVDPIFTFNRELPDVELTRTVQGRMICNDSGPVDTEFTTASGERFVVPWQQTMERGPSLKLASETRATGAATPVIDNREELAGAFAESVGCGCTVGLNISALGLATILFALKGRRRRHA